jgi:hypothetical protein
MAAPGAFLFFLFLNVLFASFFTGVDVFSIEIFKHFVVIVLGSFVDFSRENSSKSFKLLFTKLSSLGHFNFELNDEVAVAHVVLEERHAKSSNYFFIFISYDFSSGGINVVEGAVKMFKFELKADQSFSKTNILLDEEISSLASEDFMWLLLNDKDKIAC